MNSPLPITDKSKQKPLPIHAVSKKNYSVWFKGQPAHYKRWLEANRFEGAAASYCLLPGTDGSLEGVVAGIEETPDLWSLAHLTGALPPEHYYIESKFSSQI